MPKLIRGSEAGPALRAEILARFIYRWTKENLSQSRRLHGKAPPRMEPATDAEWLASHAFWVRKDGKLSNARAHRYAEPFYLATAPAVSDHSVPGFDPICKEDRPLLPYRASWLRFKTEVVQDHKRGRIIGEVAVYLDDLPEGAKLVASFWGPSAEENARLYVAWRKGEC